jgi:hypothetical protein
VSKGSSSGYDPIAQVNAALPRGHPDRALAMARTESLVATTDSQRLVCAVLCGVETGWSGGDDPDAIATFIDSCRYHGVLPLLHAEFCRRNAAENWPREILAACAATARAQAIFELAHRVEIVRVLAALASAGAAPLLLKGAALAYSHYPSAALRPRADTDLLIPRDRRKETELALARLGYIKGTSVEGEFICSQAAWSRSDTLGATHHLDIHWRINNSQILAKALDYDELMAGAAPLPTLGPGARALAPVHALLLACIHRAGHANAPYYVEGIASSEADRLIWLYDIHLLVTRMSVEGLDLFAALAAAKQIKAICNDALRRTRECFATRIPAQVIDALGLPGPAEASARYLSGGRARQMLGDFLALERWNDRGGWIRELAFPSADYMRWRYPDTASGCLPVLYARRALTGVASLIFSRGAGPGR